MPLVGEKAAFRTTDCELTPHFCLLFSEINSSIFIKLTIPPKDNRRLEARADVLVYTSTVLEQDVEIIGPVMADLYVRSSLNHTDFFARLCVVEPSGKSINVCDGILSLTPGCPAPEADGSLRIQISLWPTAYRFRCGQRIRIQRRTPALCPYLGKWRAAGYGNHLTGRRPDGLSRSRTPFRHRVA